MFRWKRIRIAVPLLLFAAFIGWAYFNWFRYERIHPHQLIPQDAVLLVETEQPLVTWRGLMDSPFWQQLSTHPQLKEISASAQKMNSWITENPRVSRYFGDHHLIFSLHMTAARDYDFLFAFDLENASSLSLERLPLKRLLTDSFTVQEERYRDHSVYRIGVIGDNEPIYLAQKKNYLLLSFKRELLHAGLDQSLSTRREDPDFELAYTRAKKDQLAFCVINLKRLPYLAGVYLQEIGGMEQLGEQLAYASLDMTLEPERWSVSGFSGLDPKRASYARLLQQYGRGKIKAHEFLSNRTAFLQSIHLDDAPAFYQQLMRVRETEPEGVKDYAELKQQIEGVLDLSLEAHILSWIGDEIVLAEMGGPLGSREPPGHLIAIKARDRAQAKQALNRIQEEIIHRTPARFSSFTYKGYTIHYLEWKSLFRLLLGPSQRGMTRPYYTLIGDHVVFSDRPETLIQTLEDFEDGQVLANDPDFKAFYKQAGKDYSSLSYLNVHFLYPVLAARIYPDQRRALQDNMNYFSYLDHWRLVLKPDAQGFTMQLEVSYARNQVFWNEPADLDSLIALFKVVNHTSWLSAFKQPEQERTEKHYTRFYPDGSIRYKLARKDGLPHGAYREFYPDGTLRCKGSYRKGSKRGKWEWYGPDGELIQTLSTRR